MRSIYDGLRTVNRMTLAEQAAREHPDGDPLLGPYRIKKDVELSRRLEIEQRHDPSAVLGTMPDPVWPVLAPVPYRSNPSPRSRP